MRQTIRCTSAYCEQPTPPTEVDLPELVPGILIKPTLICAHCGCELYQVDRTPIAYVQR